jgi:hypothetical protein
LPECAHNNRYSVKPDVVCRGKFWRKLSPVGGSFGELDDEENSLKIMLDRIFHSMHVDKTLTHDQKVVTSRGVALLSGRIESIHRSRKVVYDNQTALDKVWDELKFIPPEED